MFYNNREKNSKEKKNKVLNEYIITEIDKLDRYEGRYEADELFTDEALNSYKVIEETV